METTSLGFIDGMFFGRGRKAADGPKVLDWERAAEVCASTDEPVWAGLAEDWEYTHGLIGDGGEAGRRLRLRVLAMGHARHRGRGRVRRGHRVLHGGRTGVRFGSSELVDG